MRRKERWLGMTKVGAAKTLVADVSRAEPRIQDEVFNEGEATAPPKIKVFPNLDLYKAAP